MVSPEPGTTRPRLSLAVLSLVLFVTFLDNTIVAAALANIQTGCTPASAPCSGS